MGRKEKAGQKEERKEEKEEEQEEASKVAGLLLKHKLNGNAEKKKVENTN